MAALPHSCRFVIILLIGLASFTTSPIAGADIRGDPGYIAGFDAVENLCFRAEAFRRSPTGEKLPSLNAIDGSLNTGELLLASEAPLEIRFIGRPPWVNEIVVYHDADLTIELRARDIYKTETDVGFILIQELGDDGRSKSTFRGRGMRLTSLLLAPTDFGSGRVYETEAYFRDSDTDDGIDEVAIEWINNYHGSDCGGSSLDDCGSDARQFANELKDELGWERPFTWSNEYAWEWDFDEGNEWWVDRVDAVFFSGHGNVGRIFFADNFGDDEFCELHSSEVQGEWGNNDLEWVFFHTCQTLRVDDGYATIAGWLGTFNGLHCILGFHSNSIDVTMGDDVGDRLARRGQCIFNAWKNGARQAYGVNWGRHHRTVVGVAPRDYFLDEHVWGKGTVNADLTNLGGYGAARSHTFHAYYKASHQTDGNPWEDHITFGDSPNSRLSFDVTTELAAREQRDLDSLTRLLVQPRNVNQAYAEQLAEDFCINYGMLCNYDLVYNQEMGCYDLFDGPHELIVYEATGGWEYSQSELEGIRGESPPTLPNDVTMFFQAENIWMDFGGIPQDTSRVAPGYIHTARINLATGEEEPDSSWDMEATAAYMRVRQQMPILGPGAGLEVVFGDNSEIHGIFHGGWRDVVEAEMIPVVGPIAALTNLATCGGEISLTGLPLYDEMTIYDYELGYYEPEVDSLVDELQPIWIFSASCISDSDTSDYYVLLPAEYLNPHATIVSPSTDTLLRQGAVLTLEGNATGTGPFSYYWYSDIDELLDSGQVANVSGLSAVGKNGAFGGHTITLEVTDSNGLKDLDAVTVVVYICGDCNADGLANITDAVYLIQFIFNSGPAPSPLIAGDVNCDGLTNITDAVYLIQYIFGGGPPPCDTDNNSEPDC